MSESVYGAVDTKILHLIQSDPCNIWQGLELTLHF